MSNQLDIKSGGKIEGGLEVDTLDIFNSKNPPIKPGAIRLVVTNGVLMSTLDGVTFTQVGAGQSPSNVQITGGSIVGVNTATRTVQGAESAGDKAFLDDYTAFQHRVHDVMLAAVPNLTGFSAGKPGQNSAGGAAANDGNVEGGGVTSNGTDVVFGNTVAQNTPGGNWAIGWRAQVTSIGTSGNLGELGLLSSSGGSIRIWIGGAQAFSTTNFIAIVRNAGGGGNSPITLSTWDANWHDFVITDDATTIKFWIDGALVGSLSTRTNLTAIGMSPFLFSSTTGNTRGAYWLYGYVAP